MKDKRYLSYSKNNIQPLSVKLIRGRNVESVHRVHAVVTDSKARIIFHAGDFDYLTFIRSSLKPFQAIPFVSSGASEKIKTGNKGLAISSASHSGSTMHGREVFKLLWNSQIDINYLKTPKPKWAISSLQHNCSGKHASMLATCKKMNWPLESYLSPSHPIQKEIKRKLAELLNTSTEKLELERDDCGCPTFLLHLSQMALLYAHLGNSQNAELEQISRAMLLFPELVAGEGFFDTELMKRSHGQILSKGGAEGIQCISRIGEGLGLAIKVEDGSKRAKHASALHILRQLEWLTPVRLDELEEKINTLPIGQRIEVEGKLSFVEP